MVICLERGAELRIAQLMLVPLTVSLLRKIHTGFTSLVPAHLGSPGQRAVNRVCVCVLCKSRGVMTGCGRGVVYFPQRRAQSPLPAQGQ